MNKTSRREKMKTKENIKKIFGIVLMVSVISWVAGSGLHAADTDAQVPLASEQTIDVASAINTSSFTLVSNTFEAQKPTLNLDLSRVRTRESGFGKVESALYTTSMVSLIALNVADYFSTKEALKHEGLAEGNPIMKPFVKNDLAFAAVKLGITIGNYYFMKKLHKKNKTLAWVLSVASNFAMSYIVANNLKMIQSVEGR
jgi:hypothetical protein